MLRSLSRFSTLTKNTNNLLRRSFHDCPTNSIQPLRLLLIGCPVSESLPLLEKESLKCAGFNTQ